MTIEEQKQLVASKIDHAVLSPLDGENEVIVACSIAKKYKIASVCVKPSFVPLTVKELSGTSIAVSTVVGFPHGGTTLECKYAEAEEAIKSGATEIDMVINLGKLKDDDFSYVQSEINKISSMVHSHNGILKVIIEAALLNTKQKINACKLAEVAGADYVKTSTGFASGGATIEDIQLIKVSVSPKTKIKASAGIKTLQQALEFINEGCNRLGTSRTESILSGKEVIGAY